MTFAIILQDHIAAAIPAPAAKTIPMIILSMGFSLNTFTHRSNNSDRIPRIKNHTGSSLVNPLSPAKIIHKYNEIISMVRAADAADSNSDFVIFIFLLPPQYIRLSCPELYMHLKYCYEKHYSVYKNHIRSDMQFLISQN